MNEDSMMKKAARPIEKNRRMRNRPAKIRHLQKQQKLWMASKVKWRKSGRRPGLAPSSLLPRIVVDRQCRFCTTDFWSSCAA